MSGTLFIMQRLSPPLHNHVKNVLGQLTFSLRNQVIAAASTAAPKSHVAPKLFFSFGARSLLLVSGFGSGDRLVVLSPPSFPDSHGLACDLPGTKE